MTRTVFRFRPMTAEDLPLMHEWIQRPHVRRWWSERSYEDVVERYLPAIEGERPTDLYVIMLDEDSIGYIQTYLVSDYPEYAELVGAGKGTAGVDLFIADEALTGGGLGTGILRRFVAEIVFARPETTSCVADPDVRNVASVRAFEKAGFRVVREFFDPSDGQMHALVRLDRRQGAQSAPR
ncbi:MAG TPA: GNAT family N-acetyltransferase [Gaiellaceae bacterium]|nr:GNAT family N-acetyltransferase [Gaiellaceae bacterium]